MFGRRGESYRVRSVERRVDHFHRTVGQDPVDDGFLGQVFEAGHVSLLPGYPYPEQQVNHPEAVHSGTDGVDTDGVDLGFYHG